MPRRTDIESICVIGSGPIVIGQACEFDYSGCQALKVLREDGFRTIVVNSNPATIMTDPGFADRTYIEPLDVEGVDRRAPPRAPRRAAADARRPDGAQPRDRARRVGHPRRARRRADRRRARRDPPRRGPLALPRRGRELRPAHAALADRDRARPARARSRRRPSCGPRSRSAGTAAASPRPRRSCARSSSAACARARSPRCSSRSPCSGWDEFELEVIRDLNDNVVIVCSIENLDPMGVHTGDSVTVAPQMTLSDEAYQELRDASVAIIRAVGVETGGSNIQFARNRETGEIRVIEMNPRVSRSSALASKATGYPIAKVAAKLAVGYTLDEIPNDLTKTTPASFEPTLDYVVVKFPRFAFEKFPGADTHARHPDEVGRRGDGHRPHVHGGVPEGLRLARARPRLGDAVGDVRRHPGGRPSVVQGAARLRAAGARLARHPARQARRLGRRLDRRRLGHERRRRAPHALREGDQALVPPRRLLRRRGRGRLELLLLDLGRGGRGAAAGDEAARRDHRLRPEPDRPGDRVRLLLRPRGADVPRRSATRR